MREDQFPRIKDALAVLQKLVDEGYGDLPVQMMTVPDSTLQALVRAHGKPSDKPGVIIGFTLESGREFNFISPDRLDPGNRSQAAVQ